MSEKKIEILERALKREKAARKAAEKILEDKSKELFSISEKLKKTNTKLNDILDEKSSKLKRVFENINDAYLIIDLSANVIEMNDVAQKVFGYNIEDGNFNLSKIIYKDDVAYALSAFEELKEKGFFNNFTIRIFTKNKEVKWVQVNGTLVFNKENKPIAAQGIIRDITEDIKSQNLIKESENRLSSLLLNLKSAVLLEDENRKIVLTNNKFCELFKIPVAPDLLKGEDCTNAAEQSKSLFKNPDTFVKRIKVILANKKQVLGEELLMENGTILERDFIPITIENEYKGHLWTYKDVTLQSQYHKIIKAQKEKYSNIITNMNLGLLEVNKQDQITMANNSFCKMSGYTEKELLGKVGSELFLADKDKKTIQTENNKRAKGVSTSYEITIINKLGKKRNWLISGAPNYNDNGELIGSIGVHLDITHLKELEAQKAKILKELESSNKDLQEYAHIVSHDLKSPLRSIDALVSWVKADNQGKLDDVTLQNFNLIETTLETMENLISNVLEYSSAGSKSDKSENVDLQALLKNLKEVLYIPKHITLNITNKLPIIQGDSTKFQQLFQNFISNSIKFCDKAQGIITIDCIEHPTYYQFSVKDNGMGIEKKYHDKIFQVFHSLNKRADSTGIGLSIVKKIINLYEGDIWLESEVNQGTTFYFTLKK
ncbi:PAS domain S-box protein [uncultured Polaribacter sp.]|uniref:PAS domain S-box protein n=1 Tax=uncultured Polaribacter sp. TaxID=174711 RepID=UPI002611DBFE|nr:PAS domain S-box protein [uncultured Polaribacter sp.]